MRKIHLLIYLVLILVVMGLSACTPSVPAETTGSGVEEKEEPTAVVAAEGGEMDGDLSNTLIIAENEQPFSFDPMFTDDSTVNRMTVLAYDALVQYKPGTTEIIPWLAKEWEVSEDGLSYTFILNEGVKFHDGTDLTASDVKFTFDPLTSIAQGISYELWNLQSVEIIDDYTVKLNLGEPSIPFFKILPKMFIISEDGVKANEQNGDSAAAYLSDHDLGSGPYQLTSFVPEQQAILEKYDDYWQGWEDGQVGKVIYSFIKESATQRLMLEKGDIDISMDPSVDDLPTINANPDLFVDEGSTIVEFFFHMRTIHKPLDDIRVRKALALAYDYSTHMNIALGGSGVQAQGPYARSIPNHNDDLEIPSQNLEEAKALLAEAGYPDGGFTLKVAYEQDLEEQARAFEILQTNLGELGITVEGLPMDWGAKFDMEQDENSEPDIYEEYYWSNAADPDSSLRDIFHGASRGVGGNASWYQNEEVDRLMDEGVGLQDEIKRDLIYKDVQQLITDDQPSIFVSNPTYPVALRKWVEGYVYNPMHHQTIWAYSIKLNGKP